MFHMNMRRMDGLLVLEIILYVSFIFICLMVFEFNNVSTNFLPAGSVHYGGADISNNGFIYFTLLFDPFLPYIFWCFVVGYIRIKG